MRLPRQHRVTIKEIARMCHVSTQTVSRVINNRPDVSVATRSAVKAAIASAGFQPSAVARSLVQRRSQTLGVIVAGLHFFGVAQTLNGIAEASEEAGYALLLKEVDGAGEVDILPVMDFFIGQRVDGIIFAAPDVGRNLSADLPAASPPMVFLQTDQSTGLPTIAIDNAGGARLATEHLIALGRRRIAHVAGPLAWREARDRRDAWLESLQAAALQPGPVAYGNWTSASGMTAFDEVLALAPDTDAVFVANDQMALGVLHLAHVRGIDVPGDIAVVGFDGLEEAAQFTPPLTTVVQPLRELGREAVQELLATMDEEPHPGRGLRRTLLTHLVVRESAPAVAPLPAAAKDRALAGAGSSAPSA
jgi:LacI family transcriptional regulator